MEIRQIIFAAIISLTSVVNIAFAANDNENEVSYTFQVPYEGAGEIIIKNETDDAITIKSIEFNTSVNISGTPYGTLMAWGSRLEQKNTQHYNYIYILQEPSNGLVLGPHQTANLIYPYSPAEDSYSIPMPPTSVKVNTTQS